MRCKNLCDKNDVKVFKNFRAKKYRNQELKLLIPNSFISHILVFCKFIPAVGFTSFLVCH